MTRRRRRGWLMAIAALAAADAVVVALRQTGLIRRLPEPPGGIWDTNRVVTSPVAYAMGVPDAPLASLVYLAMIGFAARLGRGNARRRPWSALGLAAGAAGAAGGGAFYLWHMLAREKKLCPYCLGTAAASFTMLPLALPELRELFA
ncbi:MAG TPA: vitamin K epoxide reductase family protein [Polyangia bacterium]|nr:vitamin K epoxide reductase family protein [Polyangia bacterium]